MTDDEQLQQWETDGGLAIVETVRRERKQYETGPQGNQFHLTDAQRCKRS